MQHRITIKEINDVLPQTQCGLCSYGGCKPYATAIVEKNETINRCPPGGLPGLLKLAKITGQDATPYLGEIKDQEKPRRVAVIREDECIGCTKCISACPIDAILGASKYMHTVIQSECSGCELCVAPCPVDCIDILQLGSHSLISIEESAQYRKRFENRTHRLEKEKNNLQRKHQLAKTAYKPIRNKHEDFAAKKKSIIDSVNRINERKKLLHDT
jgi:electron transport complex protein RnfB